MERKIRQYSEEFKQEAVHLALQSDSVSGVAHDLGMPEATLHTWVHKVRNQGIHAYSSSSEGNGTVNVGELIDENTKLRKRLARLEQEKAILKKAATYFAKELR